MYMFIYIWLLPVLPCTPFPLSSSAPPLPTFCLLHLVQEPVSKWQQVDKAQEGESNRGSAPGSNKDNNLLELFYADPKRCVRM